MPRTLAEVRSRRSAGLDKRGTSLLEFISDYGGINDPGGELRARDAEVIKRGRGKKTLRLSRGRMAAVRDMFGSGGKRYGLDDVAQAAIEAGYMADDPVVMEYQNALREGRQVPEIGRALLDAIDRELSGEAQYSPQARVDEAAIENDEALDQIEEYLGRLGVDLNDDDATIRAAIEADQDEQRRAYAQVSPEQARLIDMPVELPADPLFAEAVANTPGATITDEGLLIDLVRYQKPEQEGATSVRTGVFYLPVGSSNVRHYKKGGQAGVWYGGPREVRGQTLIKRPLFLKGATGGKAPETAYEAIKGKGSMAKLDKDIMHVIGGLPALRRDGLEHEAVSELLEQHGADPDLVWDILENSKQGNQLRYALRENIIAHAIRDAGYDAMIGYSKGKAGAFISEVFDVREVDYPTPGQTAALHPDFARRTMFQNDDALSRDLDTWSKRIDDLIAGKVGKNQMMRVGRVTSPMRAAGIKSGNVTILAGKLAKIARDHPELGVDTIRRLPELLSDPVAIMGSGYSNGSKIVALNAVDSNGDPVIAAVLPGADSGTVLLSVYGKTDGAKWISDQLNRDIDRNQRVYLRDGLRGETAPSVAEGSRDDGTSQPDSTGDLVTGSIPIKSPRKAAKYVVDRAHVVKTYPRGLYQGDTNPRGSIQFPLGGVADGETIISLFQSANLSTFLHESGHYFLANLVDRAAQGSAVAQERMAVVREWWRSNADAVATGAMRAVANVEVTTDDVTAWLDNGTTGDAVNRHSTLTPDRRAILTPVATRTA